MLNYSRYLIIFCCFFLFSCGNVVLPPLEVESCTMEEGVIVVYFTAPPAPISLETGLTVTEDGEKMEGDIKITSTKAEFHPRYGIKDNRDYCVRIEAGTEDIQGHSLMETFIYEHFTGTNKAPFTVEFTQEIFSRDSNSLDENQFKTMENHITGDLSSIQLRFSQSVDKKSLEDGLSLSPDFEHLLVYGEEDKLVRIVPVQNLDVNQRYIVFLSSSVIDKYRNRLAEDTSWSFYYKRDERPVTIKFFHQTEEQDKQNPWFIDDSSQPLMSSEEGTSNVSLKEGNSLGLHDWIVLEFSEELDLDEATKSISLVPVQSVNIEDVSQNQSLLSPSLEIIKDYEGGNRIKVRPNWDTVQGGLEKIWGTSWKLMVDSGLKDRGGNEMTDTLELNINYGLEQQRPPRFVGALLKDDVGGAKVAFSPQSTFTSLNLEPEKYPNRAETLPSQFNLYLFFVVSQKDTEMNQFSLMENVSLSATNNCCDLTLKRVLSKTDEISLNSLFEEYKSGLKSESSLENVEQDFDVASLVNNGKLVTACFQVELVNQDARGIITLEVSEGLTDSLGNSLQESVICRVNKL